MHIRQTSEHVFSSILAVLMDAIALFIGLYLATWIRFDADLFPIDPEKGVPSSDQLVRLILLAMAVFLVVFQNLGLFKRPHQGRFEDMIPRILRAIFISFVLYFAFEAALRMDPQFSRKALTHFLGNRPLLRPTGAIPFVST